MVQSVKPLLSNLVIVAGLGLVLNHCSTSMAADPKPDKKGLAFFEKKIRPVLVESCYECHSTRDGNKVKGGLALDTRDGLLRGGESGPSLVPGSPEDSLLIEALRHDGLQMPPNKKLSGAVISDFVAWVKMGAPDPRESTGAEPVVAKKEIDIEAGRKFWAFQLPKPAPLPAVKDASWPKSDVDSFILAELEAKSLAPVGDADARVWIRRVYFDLTGLPPTPTEIDEFVRDPSPRAKEAVVDRLLASRHFGERWARHWLDVARFAESNGNTDNVTYPHAWRYRDYVIDALNSDKPFDQFIREQIAGDLLPTDNSKQRDEYLIATGFLAIGSKPRAQNNPDFQMDVVAEQIEVATTGFMALTVACARCHDHKFDPIPTREYYAMAGIFTSTDPLYSTGGGQGNGRQKNTGFHQLTGSADIAAQREKNETALAELRETRTGLMQQLRKLGAVEPNNPDKKKGNKPNAKKAAKQQAKKGTEVVGAAEIKVPTSASPEDAQTIKRLTQELRECVDDIKELTANGPASTSDLAMGVRDVKKPDDCQLCVRGDSKNLGPKVPRSVISVATIGDLPKIDSSKSGRVELANWIASPNNPLTARVAVNRIWQHIFGRGLVASVDNFGELGERPSHPALLDHLALQFVHDGWSTKKMIKSLILTRTYGLSSTHVEKNKTVDPDNVYQWRHSPRRLDSDQFRDAMLAASGQLDLEPMQASIVAKTGEDVVQQGKLAPTTFSDPQSRHRSIYLPIVRNAMPEALELFDAPDPSLVVGVRDTTTVPAQSLYLMNSGFVVEQSRQFAKRLLATGDSSDKARIQQAVRLAFHRDPTASETEQLLDFVKRSATSIEKTEKDRDQVTVRAWAALSQALFASAEFRYVD